MGPHLPREATLLRIEHPDPLRAHGITPRVLIDDPVADRIQRGDPTFGWEGDQRLALYIDRHARFFELWRLESDNRYRRVAMASAELVRVGDLVPSLILFLVSHDGRRDFDALAHVDKINAAVQRDKQRQLDEFTDEAGDRLVHALKKDGVEDAG